MMTYRQAIERIYEAQQRRRRIELRFIAGLMLATVMMISTAAHAGCNCSRTESAQYQADTRSNAPDPFANTKATLQNWDVNWWKGRVMLSALRDFINWSWRDFTLPKIPTDPVTGTPRAGYGYTRYSGA